MHSSTKKLFLAITLLIIAGGLLLARQIKTALSITVTAVDTPLVSPMAIDLPTTPADPLLGNPGAPLTVVVFGDMDDTPTRSLLATTINFVNKHPTDVRLIFKLSPQERLWGTPTLANKTLWCTASSNQQFWTLLKDLLSSPDLTEDQLKAHLEKLHLNAGQLLACAKLSTTEQALANTENTLKDLGVYASPALFVNNKEINLKTGVNFEQMLTTFIEPQ